MPDSINEGAQDSGHAPREEFPHAEQKQIREQVKQNPRVAVA
jgi:hypothetical protein